MTPQHFQRINPDFVPLPPPTAEQWEAYRDLVRQGLGGPLFDVMYAYARSVSNHTDDIGVAGRVMLSDESQRRCAIWCRIADEIESALFGAGDYGDT